MIRYSVNNPREQGFEHERNDCTVRALHHVTGVPYREAHAYMRSLGRCDGKGYRFESLVASWEASKTIVFGYRVTRVHVPKGPASSFTRYSRRRGGFVRFVRLATPPTLEQQSHKLRSGRFLVFKRAHVFAAVDGTIHDSYTVGARSRVVSIWQFEPSSVVEARERGNVAAGY